MVHDTGEYVGLSQQIKQAKLIKDDNLQSSLLLLEGIKKFRDNIAHDLDYFPENDIEFLKRFGINNNMSLNDKKQAIVINFKDIIFGVLMIKLGLKKFSNFLILKVD